MKQIKKQLIIGLLTVLIMFSAPIKAQAFIGELLSLLKGVSETISTVSRIIKWVEMTREVMDYPNEYIREVNAIIDDIETLKRVVRQANLSVADMRKFLELAQKYVNVIHTSLSEFQGIVSMVDGACSIISGDSGDSVNLEEMFQRIKTMHKTNMDALDGAKRIVNNTKAMIAGIHAANTVVNASKQLK